MLSTGFMRKFSLQLQLITDDSLFCTEPGMCFAETGNYSVGTGNCSTLMPVCFLQILPRIFFFSRKLYVVAYTIKLRIRRVRRIVFFDPHHPVFEAQAGVRQVQLERVALSAPSGRSRHEFGEAADIARGPVLHWLHQNAGKIWPGVPERRGLRQRPGAYPDGGRCACGSGDSRTIIYFGCGDQTRNIRKKSLETLCPIAKSFKQSSMMGGISRVFPL